MKLFYTKEEAVMYELPVFETKKDVPITYITLPTKLSLNEKPNEADIKAFYVNNDKYIPLYAVHLDIPIFEQASCPKKYKECNSNEQPDALWYFNGKYLKIYKKKRGDSPSIAPNQKHLHAMDEHKLKGVFTERMVAKFGIPLEACEVFGTLGRRKSKMVLYNLPEPWNQIDVYFDNDDVRYWGDIPEQVFTKTEIKKLGLEPVKEEELPQFIYHWFSFDVDRKHWFINYYHRPVSRYTKENKALLDQ